MARVNLRCTSCGFHFSVTDAQASKPEGVRCPSCLAPVGVSGPVEGGPARQSVRALESTADTGALKIKIGIGVGVAVAVLAIVAVVVLKGGSAPEPASNETSTPKRPGPTAKAETKKPATTTEKKAATPKLAAAPKADAAPEPTPQAPAPLVAPTSPQAGGPALPDDLFKWLREELMALKEWHLNLVLSAPEKARADKLLALGKAEPEDVEFLRGVMNGPRFRAVKEEVAMIRETRARLETEALEGLPVDKVIMTDGRVLHGRIGDETDTVVKLELKVASGLNSVPLQKADIKEVQKGKGLGSEFKTRWEPAKKGGPPALAGLLAWCKENPLPLQASLAAYAILVDDPGRSEARQSALLATDPVARMLKAEQEGGFITHEGRRWVPSELKAKLLRDGYALMDGHWLKKAQQPKIVTVPSLFQYENQNVKPVQLAGPLAQEESITYTVVQGQEKADVKAMRRFYAQPMIITAARGKGERTRDADVIVLEDKGTPAAGQEMRGEVSITVPLPAPILEASVMTAAEVKAGGLINVYQIVDGRRELLYKCASKESSSHKLLDAIRGKTEVQLVAEVSGRASYSNKTETKRIKGVKKDTDRVIERGLDMTFKQLVPEYPAMLFPSNANTQEVFRLTVTLAEPAPAIDKLFENAK